MKKYLMAVSLIAVTLSSQAVLAGVCKYPNLTSENINDAEMVFSGEIISTSRGLRHNTEQKIKVLSNVKNAKDGDVISVYKLEDFNPTVKQGKKNIFVVLGKKQTIDGLEEATYIAPLCDGTVHYPLSSKNARAIQKYLATSK